MTSLKKKSAVILFLLLIGITGYSQIQSVSQISVDLFENIIINKNQNETNYEIKLKFENPSLLTLPAGKTEFFVSYDDEIVGNLFGIRFINNFCLIFWHILRNIINNFT